MDKLQKTTVKHSKKLNLPFLQRKMFSFEKTNNLFALVITILLSSIIGTYLDAFLFAKQLYSFPVRPFPSIFSVNIGFTLFVLPILTTIFIQISKNYLQFLEFFLLFQSVFVLAFLNRLLKDSVSLFIA